MMYIVKKPMNWLWSDGIPKSVFTEPATNTGVNIALQYTPLLTRQHSQQTKIPYLQPNARGARRTFRPRLLQCVLQRNVENSVQKNTACEETSLKLSCEKHESSEGNTDDDRYKRTIDQRQTPQRAVFVQYVSELERL